MDTSSGPSSRPSLRRAVVRLLRDVTWPALRRHRLRTALTLVGVVIGVQLFVTIQLVNRATIRSLERTITTIAGDADLQLSNGDAGVAEELVERMAAVPGVANASGLVRGTLQTEWGVLTVFGVDLFGDQRVRERQFPRRNVHIGDELRFADAGDSIALSRSFAASANLAEGQGLDTVGPSGRARLVVRGFLDPVGPATLFGGAVALLDLPTAQRLFARAGRVDEIAVALAPDADRVATTRRLEAVVAGAGGLRGAQERLGGVAGMLSGFRAILSITSMLGLTVGFLLVYHAMWSAVRQRRRTFAIARALGYRRSAVAGAILVEAALFGGLGAVIGAGLAVGAARLAIDTVTAAVAVIWARGDRALVTLGSEEAFAALAVGVVGALVAATGPALAAARLEILDQLRPSVERRRTELGWRTVALGLGCCAAAGAAFWCSPWCPSLALQLVAISTGSFLMTIGYAALAPGVLRCVAAPVRRLAAGRSLPITLAAEHLARDPVRCRGTLGALMAAFAFVLCVMAFVGSLGGTILAWIDQALAADLYVNASPDLPLPSAPTLPAAIEDDVRGVPGVIDVTPTRMLLAPLDGELLGLKATRVAQLRVRPFPVLAHLDGDYLAAYARGEAALASENLAARRHLRLGDTVVLDSPSGRQSLRIAAIIVDYSIDLGTLTIDTDVYRRLWKDEQVTTFLVHTAPGADLARIRADVTRRTAPRAAVYVITAGEFKRNIMAAIDAAFALTYAIQLVAAVIAGIGVVNFFLAEIVDRRREIGLLRTVALDRGQLRRSLTAEAVVIGACGGLLAIAWGWPIAYLVVTHSARLVSGWRLDFDFPWSAALSLPLVVAVTSGLAAALPVRATSRTPLTRLVAIE